MKHKRNTKNTLSVRLFTMLLTCSLLLAGVPSAVLAGSATEVLRIDFSSEEGFTKGAGATVESGALKLSAVGDSVSLKPLLKVNTNYTFSFKMKNSVADALSMVKENNFFYYRNGKDKMEDKGSAYGYFVAGGSFSYVISDTTKFGAERTGDAANAWRNVSVNFTTPRQAEGDTEAYVNLCLECAAQDDNLYVDDLVITETGNEINRVFNGDFEAFDASKDTLIPTSFVSSKSTNTTTWEVVEDGGNHYLKVVPVQGKYVGAVQGKAFLAKMDASLPNNGTRFKFSMKYMANKTNGPRLSFQSPGNGLEIISNAHFPLAEANTWETYTAYLDGSRYLAGRTDGVGKHTWKNDLWFGFQAWEYYIDDLYCGFDTTGIDFYEKLEFYHEEGGDRYITLNPEKSGASADKGTDEMIMTEKSTPALSLADITPDENGYRLVTPRLHYIPTANADGTYDAQDITFIAAVYCMEGDKKVLYSMDIADGKTAADGKTIDIKIDNVKVPKEEGYYIEAMAWDGTNTMKPIAGVDKTIFN